MNPYHINTCMVCGNKSNKVFARWMLGVTCSRACNNSRINHVKESINEGRSEPTRPASQEETSGGE
jgi:hypothetical protein